MIGEGLVTLATNYGVATLVILIAGFVLVWGTRRFTQMEGHIKGVSAVATRAESALAEHVHKGETWRTDVAADIHAVREQMARLETKVDILLTKGGAT